MNQATTFLHSRSNFERLFFYLLSRIWPHFLGCNIKRHKQTNFAGNRVVRGKRELLYGTLLSKLNWISSPSRGTPSKSWELLQRDIFLRDIESTTFNSGQRTSCILRLASFSLTLIIVFIITSITLSTSLSSHLQVKATTQVSARTSSPLSPSSFSSSPCHSLFVCVSRCR